MKTTVELPDDLLRRARIEAATHGTTLKQLLIEALEQRLERGPDRQPAWREHVGALRDLRRETRRIESRIAEEFEVVSRLGCSTSTGRQPRNTPRSAAR